MFPCRRTTPRSPSPPPSIGQLSPRPGGAWRVDHASSPPTRKSPPNLQLLQVSCRQTECALTRQQQFLLSEDFSWECRWAPLFFLLIIMIIISTVQTLTWHTFPHKYKYTPTNSAEDDLFMREGDIDKHIQNSRYLIGGIAQVTF